MHELNSSKTSLPNKVILILFYSRTGNTQAMAQLIQQGIITVSGVVAQLRTVPPISTVCEQTEPSIPDDGAAYVTLDELRQCDGLALGSPTRFGQMAAPLKYFWDQTGNLWLEGSLIDKPAAVFTATSTPHGGQESTLLSMMLPLFHHGMMVMGVPFSQQELFTTQGGGTPYGASLHSKNQPHHVPLKSEKDLCIALGKRLAQWTLVGPKSPHPV